MTERGNRPFLHSHATLKGDIHWHWLGDDHYNLKIEFADDGIIIEAWDDDESEHIHFCSIEYADILRKKDSPWTTTSNNTKTP